MTSSSILENLAHTTTNFAIAAIMLSLLTAIFMQALYEIGLRAYFQRQWVRNWLVQRLTSIKKDLNGPGTRKPSTRIFQYLEMVKDFLFRSLSLSRKESWISYAQKQAKWLLSYLEGRGREGNIYSLNYQQLCGQIASTVQGEIDEPREPVLLQLFALGVGAEEIEKLGFGKDQEGKKPKRKPPSKTEVARLHERISFYAEKGVDDLQINLGRLWRKNNYLLNLLCSLVLTLFLSLLSTQFELHFTELTWVLLSVGVAGGLVAPIANNLLERVFYPR